ncbi:MAG: 1-deoxy-D-xylulose-5-phosphate reductoisomerase [Phycisphaerales bacterium]|nr:1-deoxy-D-xylulose-5-phosphate reductoisomerase [Phycisphaerales bacterium]
MRMSDPPLKPPPRRLILLGSTGSVGSNAVRVIEHLNRTASQRYQVVGLAANKDWAKIVEQAQRLGVRHIALCDNKAAAAARDALPGATIHSGDDAAEALVRSLATETNIVLGAIVGAAGLGATVVALEHGIDMAIANKETLVAAGPLVIPLARRTGARILPVDSEHSAVWQALQTAASPYCPPCDVHDDVRRIILTASGGPLRDAAPDEIRLATVEQVLAHPTWNMGDKITVDSASLINKALEVIEAHWLFGLAGEQIDVVIHPQSIVHSFVEYRDGSLIAQLGTPDMRTPIQYALTYPHRPTGTAEQLDLTQLRRLDFHPPDHERFPALGLAYDVISMGASTAGAVLSAANEAAVDAFLNRRITFGEITTLIVEALSAIPTQPIASLADVLEADHAARAFVRDRVPNRSEHA